MADTTKDISGVPDYSLWGDEFNMEAFKANPARWNKDWENASRTRTAAEVFLHMGRVYGMKHDNDEGLIPMLTEHMTKVQESLSKVWGTVERDDRHFVTAWLLLGEKERTRHLNKGFEDAYPIIAGRQDARCLAPEITTSALLKRNGQAFLELLEACVKGKQGVGEGNPYIHPSGWWDKALEGVPESFLKTLDENTHERMTIHRNDFITKFLVYATLSVMHDLGSGSAGMKPVTDLMTRHGSTAHSLSKAVSTTRDEPIVRCQNCETQELGPKFMVCGTCKSKLAFTIHYCSVKCQQEDWRNHKKNCGKQKIAKKLPGTIHDPFWFQPEMPDALRHLGGKGNIEVTSIGFGDPARTPTYSAALQRQVSLLTADKKTDYFLFDEMDRPIRFEITNSMLKTFFRLARTEALSSDNPNTIGGLLELIIKIMGHKPGLSRQGIIAQFAKEYERDVARDLATIERSREGSELTTLENMSQAISSFGFPGQQ